MRLFCVSVVVCVFCVVGGGCGGAADGCSDLSLQGGDVCTVDFGGCGGGDIHVVCAVGDAGDNCSCDVEGAGSAAFHVDDDPCALDRAGLNAFVGAHCPVAD